MKLAVLLILLSASSAIATPLLLAAPCEGYGEAYELVREGVEVIAVGKGFCIVRYGDGAGQPMLKAGVIELGSANRDIYIVESHLGQEWRDVDGVETLARFGDSYIVAVAPHLLATNWAGQFEIRKVFDRPIQPPDITQEYPPIEENALVREMVDRLYAKDYGHHLENVVNVTPSRYTYNPMIDVATDYLENSFNRYGLATGKDQFEISGGPQIGYNDVFWLDGEHGWISSEYSNGYKTRDSGLNWEDSPFFDYTEDIFFISPERGFSVSPLGSGLSITDNGGATWSTLETGNYDDDLYSIDFFDENTGAATGIVKQDGMPPNGNCLITHDGGLTWFQTEIPEADNIVSVCCRTADEIWVGGTSTDLYVSVDGGRIFNEMQTSGIPPAVPIRDIELLSATDAVIIAQTSIYFTEDGGTTWTQATYNGTYFKELAFIDSNRGWTCGFGGEVKYTEDGGHTWIDRDIVNGKDLRSIYAKSRDEVWGCGGDNYVVVTKDGGLSWQEADIPDPVRPKDVGINVIAELTGTIRPEEIYIICAHYDSLSNMVWYLAPGAEDNASGTAGVLHLAEIMSQYDFASTILFCCWSAEEIGLVGSEHYAEKAREWSYDIRAVYNMDMISYMDDSNYDTTIEFYIYDSLADACREASDIYIPELTLYPGHGYGSSDHGSFWDYGYPAIMAIEYPGPGEEGFYPWIHTIEDTYDHLRYDYGVLNVKLGAALIGSLAEPLSGPRFAVGDVYAYPNPARPDTDFVTFANVPMDAIIEIYTITGDKIATVYERNLGARWDMRSDSGEGVASGVYLYYLETGSDKKIGKIAVLH